MDLCKISEDIAHNCDDKLVTGLFDEIVLINHDDIDFANCDFNATNRLIVESIALKTASPSLSGYRLRGYNYSNEHNTALVKQRYVDGWDHNLLMRIFDNTPEVKEWVQAATGSRFVAIIKNMYENSNNPTPGTSVFEVLGWKFGLEISEATRNPNDGETKGAWILQAASDPDNKEPYLPYTFFDTDLATTQLAFDAF
jgi:hypothetical protein